MLKKGIPLYHQPWYTTTYRLIILSVCSYFTIQIPKLLNKTAINMWINLPRMTFVLHFWRWIFAWGRISEPGRPETCHIFLYSVYRYWKPMPGYFGYLTGPNARAKGIKCTHTTPPEQRYSILQRNLYYTLGTVQIFIYFILLLFNITTMNIIVKARILSEKIIKRS